MLDPLTCHSKPQDIHDHIIDGLIGVSYPGFLLHNDGHTSSIVA